MNNVRPASLSQLLESLPANAPASLVSQIEEAHQFAREVHQNRHRQSGELYVEHDLAVANIICSLGMHDYTLVAALLHDTLLPHTAQSADSLYRRFGPKVTALVTGLAELLAYAEENDRQEEAQSSNDVRLEKIRAALMAMIQQDVRVILLRLADVLQDLRKAGALPREQQERMAREVRNIYAPLANRLGVWQLKWELEDLTFRYLQPDRYKYIAGKIDERRVDRTRKINEAAERLKRRIQEMGLSADVTGRPKHIYSIYRKMERKNVSFEEIYDVHALRVVLHGPDGSRHASPKSRKQKQEEARSLCYQVLGAVHSLWQPIPQEFDDYIAAPKPNGYRSLHTAVMDEEGETLEIQIRTEEMDKEAELGIAAHWAYKEGEANPSASDVKRIHWFRQLVHNLREAEDPEAEGELAAQEFLQEQIYVFTPRGDVIELPNGATPVDFAYQIHTEVGHRCRGAQVNGKMVSLDYQLQAGDRVKIITASRGGPSRDWMNENLGFTASARTRSKIRSWFRQQEREKNIEHGREVVERELRRLGLNDVYSLADIAEALHYNDVDTFLAKVGFGDIQSAQIGGAIASLQQQLKPDDELRQLLQLPHFQQPSGGLTVRGVSGLATRFAGCCSPIPPEPIKGYITRGRGVTVHSSSCKTLTHITDRERLIDVEWGVEEETYPIPIVVRAYHRPGLVDDIANVLKGRQISAPRTKKTTSNSITTVYMEAQVSDLAQLEWLLERLDKLPNVFDVQRQRWN
ncbi:MAG: bifunctional (p)ppGpp synthetase/guanosine-3',5'-bis(diphosphate) 3'-pyrophosphohydrolase [Candidatus Promineifilaceae bacterium]|nr:bifunctional (p)ppGpp synthetase/guanosine-3',5'-bis(diphosphate) 3'-pyrophosphohydrolase [Candidatus Promineifilaceae bacterium]